jgi:hypothetical protein
MAKLEREGRLVEFDRKPLDLNKLVGFVLQFTDELTLLQPVDFDRMELNGYSVIRNKDVQGWRPVGPETCTGRVLKLKGIGPEPLEGLDLSSWRELLTSAGDLFPLLTLHREKLNPRVCYVGRVSSMTEKVVALKEIDPDARWRETKRYRFRDLTKVDFGGATSMGWHWWPRTTGAGGHRFYSTVGRVCSPIPGLRSPTWA